MEPAAAKLIAAGLMSFGMLGAAIGVGNVFAAMITGIARNPGAESKMRGPMMLGMALAEAMGLFALVLAFLFIFAI